MFRNRLMLVIGLLVVASMILAACQPQTPAPATPVETKEQPTPTPVPVRKGAWVDKIVFTAIDQAEEAVKQLQAGQIDIYAYSVSDPKLFETVKNDPNLAYTTAFGSYTELTFNPAGPEFADGRLNPFSNPKIREAMNMLVDRSYIVQEIYGGLAKVKFTSLNSSFVDYARYVDTIRTLEAKYAYNLDKAAQIISDEMKAMGAELVDGKWTYKGQPVVLIFIIRVEDERKEIGDYVASQLEKIGFQVDRQYKTRSEASPIWLRSRPSDGKWHVYTGGWITTAISRDDGSNFGYFYTPLGSGSPLWQAYKPSSEFKEIATKLWNNDFASMEERGALFGKALVLANEDSVRVWLADQVSFSPMSAKLQVAYDLAGGVAGSALYPYTIRFVDQEGGIVRWAQPGVLIDPWNPIAGSNWVYDTTVYRATQDYAVVPDPFTGLSWPQRIERAEVIVKEGLPVAKTLDWVDLKFSPEITVPDDAWADWDATSQKFITVGEMKARIADAKAKYEQYTAKVDELVKGVDFAAFNADAVSKVLSDAASFLKGLTGQEIDVAAFVASDKGKEAIDKLIADVQAAASDADKQKALSAFVQNQVAFDADLKALSERDLTKANLKSVVYYPADLFEKVKWQDGSPLSMGDFVIAMIMTFDPAKPESAIFDEAAVANFEAFISSFKGVKIVSTKPLIIETYQDLYQLDAENNVISWWPNYSQGTASWHALTLGIQAEADKKLAFTADKAEANKVEWMSFISGPSLAILEEYLKANVSNPVIPYEPTMGQFVTKEEAASRFANLQKWYDQRRHFWVGVGPFYLETVFPVEKSIVIARNPDFVDPADKWARFAEPRVATVDVIGVASVKAGSEASFDVSVTFKGSPYPKADIDAVKFLVFDSNGNLVTKGDASFVSEGNYKVTFSTAGFAQGSYKVEVAVTSKVVSIPAFGSLEFVVAP